MVSIIISIPLRLESTLHQKDIMECLSIVVLIFCHSYYCYAFSLFVSSIYECVVHIFPLLTFLSIYSFLSSTCASDMFSLGITMFHLMFLTNYFSNYIRDVHYDILPGPNGCFGFSKKPPLIMTRVNTQFEPPLERLPDKYTEKFISILRRMIDVVCINYFMNRKTFFFTDFHLHCSRNQKTDPLLSSSLEKL